MARRILRATYDLRDTINDNRITVYEKAPYKTPTNWEERVVRVEKSLELATRNLTAETLEAEVLWGKPIADKVKDLVLEASRFALAYSIEDNWIRHPDLESGPFDVLATRDAIINVLTRRKPPDLGLAPFDFTVDPEAIRKTNTRNFLIDEEESEFWRKVVEKVEAIETIVRPHLIK